MAALASRARNQRVRGKADQAPMAKQPIASNRPLPATVWVDPLGRGVADSHRIDLPGRSRRGSGNMTPMIRSGGQRCQARVAGQDFGEPLHRQADHVGEAPAGDRDEWVVVLHAIGPGLPFPAA